MGRCMPQRAGRYLLRRKTGSFDKQTGSFVFVSSAEMTQNIFVMATTAAPAKELDLDMVYPDGQSGGVELPVVTTIVGDTMKGKKP